MRAQAETLGFVFVFSLIILTVGAVYAGGYPALQDARDAEQIDNMERAFEVLDDNTEDILRHQAPGRATEVQLTGGEMTLDSNTSFDVTITNTSNASHNLTFNERSQSITYTDDDTMFALSFGAILRSDDGNVVMATDPGWIVGERRTVIPIAQFTPGGGRTSVGGDVTILIVADARTSRSVRSFTPENGGRANVTLTITSDHAAAWGRYLERQGMNEIDGDPSDGEIRYWYVTDEVYFPKQRIGIEFRF
jgi:hypothetical protein